METAHLTGEVFLAIGLVAVFSFVFLIFILWWCNRGTPKRVRLRRKKRFRQPVLHLVQEVEEEDLQKEESA